MRHAARNIACLLSVLVLVASGAWSSGAGRIAVHPVGDARLVLQPGKIFTTGLHVTNSTDSSQEINAHLRLPEGWHAVVFEPHYTLGAHASDVKIISLQSPASTPAGAYAIRYRACGDADSSREVMLVVSITEVKLLTLDLTDVPRYTIGTEPIRASAVLVNKGNKPRGIRLAVRPESWVRIDSSVVHLAPGEARPVTLALFPPADTSARGHVLSLSAQLEDDSTTRVQSSAWLKMLPRNDGGEQMVKFPLTLRVRAVGQNRQTGLQFDVAGASPLAGDQDYLDFLLRTPDVQRQSLLGYRDEYRASYRNGPYKVFFGDRSYSLSSLTEYGRYAFGLGAEAEVGDAMVGAFVNRNRFYPIRQEEQAAYARYSFSPSTSVGVNYLQNLEEQQGRAVTVRGASEFDRLAVADVEYGVGSLGGQQDNAVSLELSGRDPLVSYNVRYLRGGPHYPGYYKNMSFASAAVIVNPVEALRLEGYVREEQRNLLKDPSLFYAPHSRYFQIGATYGDHISMYYRGNRQNDALPNARYSTGEDLVMIRSGFMFTRTNFYATAELGTKHDLLLHASGPYRRYTLYSGFTPVDGQTYGVSLEYTTDKNLYVSETQHRIGGALTASMRFGARTMFNLSMYGSRTTAAPAQTYSSIDGILRHQFSWGHELILHGRQNLYTPSFNGHDRAFLVEYAMPVNIPLRHAGTTGTLSGQVIDTQTGSGLSDVLLYIGSSVTATDADGRFIFPAVTPDTLLLIPDLSAKGIDLITEEQAPLTVITRGGETTDMTLHVTRSATVTGTVHLYDFEDPVLLDSADGVIIDRGGLAGVIIEITREGEIHRRVSDSKGRFSFTGLRPGRWITRVQDDNLPEYHYVESANDTINIGPGTLSTIAVTILPRRRRIRIIQDDSGSEIIRRADTSHATSPTTPSHPPVGHRSVIRSTDNEGEYTIDIGGWIKENDARPVAARLQVCYGKEAVVVREPSTWRYFGTRVGRFVTFASADAT